MSAEGPTSPLGGMLAACHEPVARAWNDADAWFEEGLYGPLRAGVDAHREAFDSLGLDGECPPPSEERIDRLLDYRKLVVAQLMEPATRFLDLAPAEKIIDRLSEGLQEARDRVEQLDASVTVPWPSDALAPTEFDGIGRRMRKAVGRVVSSARKAGAEREAPYRAVARLHLRDVVIPGEDRSVVDALSDWAGWLGALESLWVAWGDAALPALVRLERMGDEDAERAWETVGAQGRSLEDGIRALLGDTPTVTTLARVGPRIDDAAHRLSSEFAIAGSFVSAAGDTEAPGADLPRARRAREAFDSWDEGVRQRIELYLALLAIMAGTTAVQRRFSWRFRDRCIKPISGLREIAKELETLAGGIGPGTDLDTLGPGVTPLLDRAREAVPEAKVVEQTVTGGSDSMVEALLAMVRQVPSSLALHSDNARPPTKGRRVDRKSVAVQELARQAYDALRVERVRVAASALLGSVAAVDEYVEGLPDVFDFAQQAAAKELEGEDDETRGRAQELMVEALRSMAESMRQEVATVESTLAEVQVRLAEELGNGSLGLFDRVAAGRMQAQLLAAQSRVADLRARLNETLGPPLERRTRKLRLRGIRAWKLVTRGFRKGTEMVGGATGERSASTLAVRALADTQALTDRLPLVYQRLFTLDPLTDASLMAGRDVQLELAMTRWRRWKTEDSVPVILHGRQGVGVTSFVNALCSAVESDGGRVVRIALDERTLDEADLVGELASALGLEASERLARLSSAVFAAEAGSLPDVVAIDNIEHLFLRVPGGTDLIERLLTLMAETEPRIFWVGGCTTSAWQLVVVGEPTAVSQVDVLELKALDADAIREAVKVRHRRSGLPIRYEEPDSGRKILRRRLRRARGQDEVQKILEDDFFEQLERSSGGDVRLALFQWLQVADFSTEGLLNVRVVEKPDFSILESLSLTQNFTLKAFLEHRTLSLSEHDEIFRLPRQESYQIFESLGNRHLIAVVPRQERESDRASEVQVDLRYQVQPLLTGAVITHLRGRNIVH